ncbi:MAG: tyrosine-type recombinase/integrase [Verrucomicrobiota bacterium]
MNPETSQFQGVLAGEMTDFLRHQRALGKRFDNEEAGLRLFDQYLVEQKIETGTKITPDLVDAFLTSRPRRRPRSYNNLLSVVRRFFKWLVRQQRWLQSPVQNRPRHATAAQTTFLFDRAQARQLLELAAKLPDNNHGRHRGDIYFLVFALMYGLGLRVAEATRLCRQDVDLERKVLVIRETKFLKSRLVPFGPKIEARLREYLMREGALEPTTPLFSFARDRSKPITTTTVTQTFHVLWPRLGLKVPVGAAPPACTASAIPSPLAPCCDGIDRASIPSNGCGIFRPSWDTSIPPQRRSISPSRLNCSTKPINASIALRRRC